MPIKVFVSKKIIQDYCDKDSAFAWGMADWLCKEHNKPCAKCGVTKVEHEVSTGRLHPHFSNNLEMLEWLAR